MIGLRPLAVCLVVFILSGCGQTEKSPQLAVGAPPAGGAASKEAGGPEEISLSEATANPKDLVIHFLQAVRDGDDELVSDFLTELARRKTTELNINVAPPGSDTAEFAVGDVEYLPPDKDVAHVASIWTDLDEQRTRQELRIVWIVRKEAAGWRVAGMVTRLSPDQPLRTLNFEDPEEVIRRQESYGEELNRRRQAARETAGAGDRPGPGPVDPAGQPGDSQVRTPLPSETAPLREARGQSTAPSAEQR